MAKHVFDQRLLALRRARASRAGQELFLHERAFEDMLDRLALVQRRFRSALLIDWTGGGWRKQLLRLVESVDVVTPDGLAGVEPEGYDLCLALGGLDTVNDLPQALFVIRHALRPESLFLGAVAGGDSLPILRAAMRAADEHMGGASPRVHPRLVPAALAGLLADAGFTMPVVDVDRVHVTYRTFADLVRDLRAMGATNILADRRPAPLTRAAADAAARHFQSRQSPDGRVTERFDLLHFAVWTPPRPNFEPNG